MKLFAVTAPLILLAASVAWPAQATKNTPRAQTSPAADAENLDTNKQTTAGARADAERAPLKLPLVRPKLVVSKAARRLELYSGGRVVREYRVALGQQPAGDKERQGDMRTPVGEYHVCVKNARSNFYLSLGLNYPNKEHAERGLRDGLITRAERDRIVRAVERGRRPPWDTALGGEIFIHGGGSASDWTWGCVALDNPDIKELFDAVPLGTPVTIKP